MSFLLSLFEINAFINYPTSFSGWLIWLGYGAALLVFALRTRKYHPRWGATSGILLLAFFIAVPIASMFFGLRLPAGNALPFPGTPLDAQGPALMVFSAMPWLMAAGMLGPVPGMLLAAFSALFIGFYDTHSLFTLLNYALVAGLFGVAVRQRFRTQIFRILSRPLISAILISFLYPLLYLVTIILVVDGELPVRLDYATSQLVWLSIAFSGQLITAGVAAELISIGWPSSWRGIGALIPSPAERSLKAKMIFTMGPLVIFIVLILLVGNWLSAENAARSMLKDRMQNSAETASLGIPFFLETGQNFIRQLASDEDLMKAMGEGGLRQVLIDDLRQVLYYDQLFVLGNNGEPILGYPTAEFQDLNPSREEILGIQLALKGVEFQTYSLKPGVNENTGRLSFISTIRDKDGNLHGVLLGRTSLGKNPFTQSVIKNLANMSEMGGKGILVDGQGVILYHPDLEMIGLPYEGELTDSPIHIEGIDTFGTRQMLYVHPVEGRAWTVITSVPIKFAQQTAMDIAAPLVGLSILMAGTVYLVGRLGVNALTGSLNKLTQESSRIASGNLDHELDLGGADEIGKLGETFEKMRLNLKARSDEMSRLLVVSQGISSLEIESSIMPVLEGALSVGASSARLVLNKSALPELEGDAPVSYGVGPRTSKYQILDDQVMDLTNSQDRVIVTDTKKAKLVGEDIPSSLMSIALRHEKENYGALWLGFDEEHRFSEEEIRFVTMLADKAALATSNVRLFQIAKIGHQRMEAILSSTTDPVMVTDHKDQLLLVNPAAQKLFKNGSNPKVGDLIDDVVKHDKLLNILKNRNIDTQSAEIEFLMVNKIFYYYANVSRVMADGKEMGRVCFLSDITHFKDLDDIKSEFVKTVSHDLRSPLTLIRGFATLLHMVGKLNEQQTSYLDKIVKEVERMSMLVNNLLDLGKIKAGVGLLLEKVSIHEIVKNVLDAMQIKADQEQVELLFNMEEEIDPVIEAHKAFIQQAVQNLVDNSIKYTNPDGKVQVSITQDDQYLLIIVEDTGIGIAPVDIPHLFEDFFRGAGGHSGDKEGSGLGLAIVKSIAERHNGNVWVESQLGQGSKFFLQLPIRQQEFDED